MAHVVPVAEGLEHLVGSGVPRWKQGSWKKLAVVTASREVRADRNMKINMHILVIQM